MGDGRPIPVSGEQLAQVLLSPRTPVRVGLPPLRRAARDARGTAPGRAHRSSAAGHDHRLCRTPNSGPPDVPRRLQEVEDGSPGSRPPGRYERATAKWTAASSSTVFGSRRTRGRRRADDRRQSSRLPVRVPTAGLPAVPALVGSAEPRGLPGGSSEGPRSRRRDRVRPTARSAAESANPLNPREARTQGSSPRRKKPATLDRGGLRPVRRPAHAASARTRPLLGGTSAGRASRGLGGLADSAGRADGADKTWVTLPD